jgi:hypothetical protein
VSGSVAGRSYDGHQNRLATRPELIAARGASAEPARTTSG